MRNNIILLTVVILLELTIASTGSSQTRERKVKMPSSSTPVVLITSNISTPSNKDQNQELVRPCTVLLTSGEKVNSGESKKTGTNQKPEPPSIISGNTVVPASPRNSAADFIRSPNSKNEKLADETLGGSMTVDVSENGNTLIKVGLAERAVAVIDFPVDDPVYKIHPGNENFVTVGCFGREPNGKCLNSPTDAIVLRPGKDFHTLGTEESAATVITIQRLSGIVVTFLVVPVKTIAENTNYVAVRYDLAEVLKNRRERGLAVNLLPLGAAAPAAGSTPETVEKTGSSQLSDGSMTNDGSSVPTDDPQVLQQSLVDEIQRVAANNPALKFSKPVYGIALARANGYASPVKDITIEVIAVRNTLPNSIRLVPDQPTLAVENKDSKDTSINVEPVTLLYTAATVEDSEILEPGRVYYFAFAYRSPILGVRQVLRAGFAQREAADAPASIELSGHR